MKKIKIFTHNDLDGVGCVVVGNMFFGIDNVDYEICSYEDINEKVKEYLLENRYVEYDETYITDISLDENTALYVNYINRQTVDVKLFDHHKTAEFLNKYDWAKVIVEDENGVKESGTSLFYKHLYKEHAYCGDEVGVFVELVRQYDTWEWKKNNAELPKKLADIFGIIGIEDFIEYYSSDYIDMFPKEFENLLKYKRIDIDNYINYKLEKVKIIEGNAVVMCDRHDCLSELGSKILDKYENIDYVALVYDGGVALRSKDDNDVSTIAKRYGGGGHKNAAGFKTNEWYKWLGVIN